MKWYSINKERKKVGYRPTHVRMRWLEPLEAKWHPFYVFLFPVLAVVYLHGKHAAPQVPVRFTSAELYSSHRASFFGTSSKCQVMNQSGLVCQAINEVRIAVDQRRKTKALRDSCDDCTRLYILARWSAVDRFDA